MEWWFFMPNRSLYFRSVVYELLARGDVFVCQQTAACPAISTFLSCNQHLIMV